MESIQNTRDRIGRTDISLSSREQAVLHRGCSISPSSRSLDSQQSERGTSTSFETCPESPVSQIAAARMSTIDTAANFTGVDRTASAIDDASKNTDVASASIESVGSKMDHQKKFTPTQERSSVSPPLPITAGPSRKLKRSVSEISPRDDSRVDTHEISTKKKILGFEGSRTARSGNRRSGSIEIIEPQRERHQGSLRTSVAQRYNKGGVNLASLISPPRRRDQSKSSRTISKIEDPVIPPDTNQAADDGEGSYEVPDSQPEDNIPATPPSSAMGRRGLRKDVESFKIKRDRRQLADLQSSEDPHRMEVFTLVKKVDVSPFRAGGSDGNWRKRRRKQASRDEDSPPSTPAQTSPSVIGTSSGFSHSVDDLDAAIQEVKADPELQKEAAETDDDTDNETEDEKRSRHGREEASARDNSTHPASSWQDSFACMHPSPSPRSSTGPNAHTISILQRMAAHHERVGDAWRTLAYRRAAGALQRQRQAITTRAQAAAIAGIGGGRMASKIEEIARTQKLRQLERAEADPDAAALGALTRIYGVGPARARAWLAAGLRTPEEVRARAAAAATAAGDHRAVGNHLAVVDLTPAQRIGLERYDDFQKRIPRDEVRAHGALVEAEMLRVAPALRLTVGGSYRRGAATSGDVDLLVTTVDEGMSDQALRSTVFDRLIPRLTEMGYVKASLTGHSSDKGATKWHGAACLPGSVDGTWRRVDILMVPPREWGAALLYFTGNDVFNRSMRLLARKKGMNLNQHGLYKDVLRGPGAFKLTKGTLVESRNEERIFEALGVPFRPPEDRVC